MQFKSRHNDCRLFLPNSRTFVKKGKFRRASRSCFDNTGAERRDPDPKRRAIEFGLAFSQARPLHRYRAHVLYLPGPLHMMATGV